MKKNRHRETYLLLFFSVLIFIVTYLSAISPKSVEFDYCAHIMSAEQVLSDGLGSLLRHNQYPLWHILVAFTAFISRVKIEYASGIVTGLLNVICYCGVFEYFRRNNDKNMLCDMMASFGVMIIGPMCSLNHIYWTPNTWHNPTEFAVRPFAVFAFLIIVELLDEFKDSKKTNVSQYIILSIMLLLSNLAKPNFAQIIIPGLGLYLIILLFKNHDLRTLKLFGCMLLSFVPCFLMTIIQFTTQFLLDDGTTETIGYAIKWMDYLNYSLGGKIYLIILFIFFPLVVFALEYRSVIRTDIMLAVCMSVSAFFEMALFEETGGYFYNGDFTWGFILSEFFLYMVSTNMLVSATGNDRHSKKRTVSLSHMVEWGVFAVQLFIGIRYWIIYITAK